VAAKLFPGDDAQRKGWAKKLIRKLAHVRHYIGSFMPFLPLRWRQVLSSQSPFPKIAM
jgi:hypothetical protein